jgi:hypothetical protein
LNVLSWIRHRIRWQHPLGAAEVVLLGETIAIVAVKLKQREIGPHKAIVAPVLSARTVLTNSPWTFVALWLRRNRKQQALFYWEQAQEFQNVSVGLPLRSAPLLLYYCFMNAAKALLAAKGVSFDERHGVSPHPKVVTGVKRTFAGEGIKIHPQGILPSFEDAHAARTVFQRGFHSSDLLSYVFEPEGNVPATSKVRLRIRYANEGGIF